MSDEIDYDPEEYYEQDQDQYDVDMESNIKEDFNAKHSETGYEFILADQYEKEKDKKIKEFMEFSCLDADDAEIVLINYNWNLDTLNDFWYENLEVNKEKCGIKQSEESIKKCNQFLMKNSIKPGICPVCICEIEKGDEIALKCNHKFCSECFREYLLCSLEDPLLVVSTKCPLKGCNLVVGPSYFLKLFKDIPDKLKLYNKCLIKNFTESNSDLKWCPNPKCGICVNVPGHGMKEIKCECGTVYCFKCLKESHRPLDCEMAQRWFDRQKLEADNSKWLLVNTKQCPNCHKYIEKNQGCNHMTCRKQAGGCGYEFCWICLGEWAPHGSSWYECKKYNPSDLDKKKEKMKNEAKYELERYINYLESFDDQEKNLRHTDKLAKKIESIKANLESKHGQPHEELEYLNEAVRTVIDCHRILKYTYVFAYYMKESPQKKLYEHHQNLLRNQGDQLLDLLETGKIDDILKINVQEVFNKAYYEHRNKIIGIVGVISKYGKNLLDEIENNCVDLIDYNLLKNN